MQSLIQDFSRFISGQLSSDELRSACERFVRANPNQRAEAAAWFEEGVKSGRVSPACWESIAGAFEAPQAANPSATPEPVTVARKYRVPLIGGAFIAIAAALSVGWHQYTDYLERETLRAAARSPASRPPGRHAPVSPEQRQEIGDSLFLAEDYLRDVKLSQAPDDLAYALSEGANNVNQILDSVLAIDAGNSRALEMKAQVADLYLKKARELSAQRQLPGALAMAQYGLKVMPDNLDLFHLRRQLCDRQPPLCAAN